MVDKIIEKVITKENKSSILLAVTLIAFVGMSNYAYYSAGYNWLQAYIAATCCTFVCRVVAGDLYSWYLNE